MPITLDEWQALVERYMLTEPACVVCQDPATCAMVYVSHEGQDGQRDGAVFALCAPCSCSEDVERQVQQALQRDLDQRGRAPWN